MGRKEIDIKLPCGYEEKDLADALRSQVKLKDYTYRIVKKSLDSRRKDRIHWSIRIELESPSLKDQGNMPRPAAPLAPDPRQGKGKKIVVVGSGPAGIFPALFLQLSGCSVTLLERGTAVEQRQKDIEKLDQQGIFTDNSNYSFGEGGAGTFSDGKLTSRSKHSKKEKQYIMEEFVRQGAPEEILYLTHPHIGSDNLIRIAGNMRRSFQEAGGTILFGTVMTDLEMERGRIRAVLTESERFPCDAALLATGHSAYDSYRMLMARKIPFRTKNFALGCRMEHPQELINRIQWGCPSLPGVKAAEYRLTSDRGDLPVYTFCMCPGGKIVPAPSYRDQNIVNGMSYYRRDGEFANAAIVAGLSLPELLNREISPEDSLNWLKDLENSFYQVSSGYRAPAMKISDFITGRPDSPLTASSYEPGLIQADLTALLPREIGKSLQEGLKDLARRLPGFEQGQILGLESKTSSPVQVIRDKMTGLVETTENLYFCGEASGYAGGIISSASDGLRSAQAILDI